MGQFLSKIAEQLDISKTTLYLHLRSRNVLIEEKLILKQPITERRNSIYIF